MESMNAAEETAAPAAEMAGPEEDASLAFVAPEHLEEFLSRNLDLALDCVEAAAQVARDLGPGRDLEALDKAVLHAQHFLELSSRYCRALRERRNSLPRDSDQSG